MKLAAEKKHEPAIPTASMADIAFLLIIFFMLTMTFEVDKTDVTLPKTNLRLEIPKKAAYVAIDPSGRIKVSAGDEMSSSVPSADEVYSFASLVVGQDPGKAFVIKADGDIPYNDIDLVMDALKRAKVRTIYLLSDQVTVDDM